jgi:hypothetical protein
VERPAFQRTKERTPVRPEAPSSRDLERPTIQTSEE